MSQWVDRRVNQLPAATRYPLRGSPYCTVLDTAGKSCPGSGTNSLCSRPGEAGTSIWLYTYAPVQSPALNQVAGISPVLPSPDPVRQVRVLGPVTCVTAGCWLTEERTEKKKKAAQGPTPCHSTSRQVPDQPALSQSAYAVKVTLRRAIDSPVLPVAVTASACNGSPSIIVIVPVFLRPGH